MNRRNFIHLLGCSCLSFGLSACGSAPITDRKQLKLIPESNLNAKAAQLYEKVKEKETLSDDTKTLNQIKEIGSKIAVPVFNKTPLLALSTECFATACAIS